MKTIEQILNNYDEYKTDLEDRFGRRLCKFLTVEQMGQIGYAYRSEEDANAHIPIPFTEENVLKQLKEDVEFGWMKACAERGLSSGMMHEVVEAWCKVLENGLADSLPYYPYGKPLFIAVDEKYGFALTEEE